MHFMSWMIACTIARIAASHGSSWSPAAYARAIATLALMNTTQKINLLHGWTNANPGYGGFVAPQSLGSVQLPQLGLEDGPQGVGDGVTQVTAFPSAMTMTSSWDPDIACQYGQAIGAEQRAKGTNVALGPGVNLARVPWGGRVYEYMGEDPFLASTMVAAYITCLQSNNVTATVKHFMGNEQETNRGGMSANIPQRAAMELYYAAFQGAIDAGVGAVMLSTNAVNLTKNYANPAVIGHLKGVMGFDGWVMTDWDGATDWSNAIDGLDQSMPGTGGAAGCPFWDALEAAVAVGNVSLQRLDDMAMRVLVPMYALGLMDDPPTPDRNLSSNARSPAHDTLARVVSEQSMVLMKNENDTLPLVLSQLSSILIVGDRDTVVEPPPNSGCVQTPYIVSPFSGVLEFVAAYFNATTREGECITYDATDFFQNGAPCVTAASTDVCCGLCAATPGCLAWSFVDGQTCPGEPSPQPAGQCFIKPSADGYNPNPGVTSGTVALPVRVTYNDGSDLDALATAAAAADVVVVVVAVVSHEGFDRDNLSLPNAADAAVNTSVAANPRTVVVVRCPGACLMPWRDSVPAILGQFVGGQEAGHALARVLFGAVNPSGKLVVSFPTSMTDTWLGDPVNPAQYPGIVDNSTSWQVSTYSEGLLMGYRWYDAQSTTPLYPFGHGLSYTTFTYSGASASVIAGGNVTVNVTVANTGSVAGAEVAQLYVSYPTAAEEPPKLLKGFRKLMLQPAQAVQVTFTLSPEVLTVWNVTSGAWNTVAGSYTALIGSSSRDIRVSVPFVR